MARTMRVCPFLLLIAASFAADPSSFALWTRSTIGEHEATLMKNVSPDHSSLETPAITVTIASACFIATPTVSPKNTTKSSML